MNKGQEGIVEAQGVETKKGANQSQSIKQLANAYKNLKANKMITENEEKLLKRLHTDIVQRWIGGNLFE